MTAGKTSQSVQPGSAAIYMGAAAATTTLANGAVTNEEGQSKLRQTLYTEPHIEQVAPGVTVFGGLAFVNMTVIEGDDGLIVYDTGENQSEGEHLLTEIRKVSDKPIVAVIYSHSHYVHGTASLIGSDDNVRIIGHPKVNANADGRGSSYFEETSPLQKSRAGQQFGRYLPKSGPLAVAGASIVAGRSGYRPVNTPVENGQRMVVAGVEMVFYTSFGSDTDDCLTVHLPASGVVLNNLFWPFLPNIYTLRGAKFRDPREWRGGLKVMRDLKPAVLISTHARTISDALEVEHALQNAIDALSAILDQTLRGILHGMGPDELRHFVQLPGHLASLPYLAETYGEVSHYGPYIFNHALGWFDGDAASINPILRSEQARRLVDAMGGDEAVLSRVREALAKREFAWAAQLVNYVYQLRPSDRDIRELKADICEHMGRVTPAQTIRNWYMSQACALRGEITIPRLAFADSTVLARGEPAETLDQYRVRIDPNKCPDMDIVVAVSIVDRNVRHAWHLRRGVVEFVEDVVAYRLSPNHEVRTDFHNWLEFFSCRRSLSEFLLQCDVAADARSAVNEFFSAFDFFEPAANSIVTI